MNHFSAVGLLFPLSAICCLAQESPAPTNHVDMAELMLDFLSRTELCLNACHDQESAQAAIPQLKALAEEAKKLAAIQASLPEPTVQDFMAVQSKTGDFINISKAIFDHIERLRQLQILTPEMAKILFLKEN